MKRADTKLMKEMNKNLIRNCFKNNVTSIAANLSKITGLSVVTVNGLLKEMMEGGEVFIGESTPSNGGRPAIVYNYNVMYRCCAILMGYTREHQNFVKIMVTNLLGNCVYEEERYFEEMKDTSFDGILEDLFQQFRTIEVISFGLPGAEVDGVITINDYPNIVGDTFLKHYKERYKVPVIFVNDINAAVSGYYHNKRNHCDNAKEHKQQTVVGLVFNKRYLPGAGIVINGDIHKGASNFAGEFAYMPLGIDWLNLCYEDEEIMATAIGKVLAIFSCSIAPQHFIIYGDFFKPDSPKRIEEKAQRFLGNCFEVKVVVSNTFEEDYKYGMIRASLDVLNESTTIN